MDKPFRRRLRHLEFELDFPTCRLPIDASAPVSSVNNHTIACTDGRHGISGL